MRFLAISDVHSAHLALPLLPAADIFLYAGDITSHGSKNQVLDFRDWLAILPYRHKVVIAGNHDRYLGDNPGSGTSAFQGVAIYLENSGCEINGIRIWGSPANKIKGKWAFNSEIDRQISIIPRCDILLVHGPPIGVLDTLANPDHHGDGIPFGGTPGLQERIDEIKPKAVVFGHVHEGYGSTKRGSVCYFNVAMQTEKGVIFKGCYELVHAPTVFCL